jgi:hypothetical protein
VLDDSTFMLPESMCSLSSWEKHSASDPSFQSFSNTPCLGIGRMGRGTEALGFNSSSSYYPPSGVPKESVSPDLTGMGADGVGFGWGGRQQLLNDFRISDHPFDLLGDFRSTAPTPDQNFINLSASELHLD